VIEEFDAGAFGVEGERLSLGVAARLSRYLQVLTQARKMGRETISSQELSEYTHINPTQIRRDLSGFGKFGKRGVGYNVDSLVSEIRKILRTAGQHNIALFGAGHLGQAIASSAIFADHGFQVVAVFGVDEAKVGTEIGDVTVRALDGDLAQVVADEEVQQAARALAERMAENGPLAMRKAKQVMLESSGRSIPEGFAAEDAAIKVILRSKDAREGSKAFMEKRKPDFTGE